MVPDKSKVIFRSEDIQSLQAEGEFQADHAMVTELMGENGALSSSSLLDAGFQGAA